MPNEYSLNSIISYVPQPMYPESALAGVLIGDYETSHITSVENATGALNPNLSDYTILNIGEGELFSSFSVRYDDVGGINTDQKNYGLTIALIGCAMITYEDDGGAPDLDTEFYEDVVCFAGDLGPDFTDTHGSFAHNSTNKIKRPAGVDLPGIIAGGTSNLIFSGIQQGEADLSTGRRFELFRTAANAAARPHAKFIIGHFFMGVDLPVNIDARSLSWSIRAAGQKNRARDAGSLSTDGTLVRRCSGELLRIPSDYLTGSNVTSITGVDPIINNYANLFDMMKVNNSYPVILSPFPYQIMRESGSEEPYTPLEYNLSARQNFFAIYGFFEDGINLQTSDFRNGLNSKYRIQFQIQETR